MVMVSGLLCHKSHYLLLVKSLLCLSAVRILPCYMDVKLLEKKWKNKGLKTVIYIM